jgi:hypothetical protein
MSTHPHRGVLCRLRFSHSLGAWHVCSLRFLRRSMARVSVRGRCMCGSVPSQWSASRRGCRVTLRPPAGFAFAFAHKEGFHTAVPVPPYSYIVGRSELTDGILVTLDKSDTIRLMLPPETLSDMNLMILLIKVRSGYILPINWDYYCCVLSCLTQPTMIVTVIGKTYAISFYENGRSTILH